MPKQRLSSAATSNNQIAAGFKKIPLNRFTTNLDYGGGKYDTATEFLANRCITNLVYDPYNRTPEHNDLSMETANDGQVQSITCFNVLNVLELSEVNSVILRLYHLAMINLCPVYIQVYEGNKDGFGHQSKQDCWQRNERKEAYITRLEKVGFNVEVANGILICTTPEESNV